MHVIFLGKYVYFPLMMKPWNAHKCMRFFVPSIVQMYYKQNIVFTNAISVHYQRKCEVFQKRFTGCSAKANISYKIYTCNEHVYNNFVYGY